MNRRFQFSLKWLFVAMLVVAAFFGGIHFERRRRQREDEAAAQRVQPLQVIYFQDLSDFTPELAPPGN